MPAKRRGPNKVTRVASASARNSGGGSSFLHGFNDLVDARTLLFAQAHAPHQGRQRLVAGAGREIDEALRLHERGARVGNLDPIPEQLHRRPGTANRHVLVDQRICHQLSDGDRGEQWPCLSNRGTAFFR